MSIIRSVKYVTDLFGGNYDKELYQKLIEEEFYEFMEAETVGQKIKEVCDLIWVCIGYLLSVYKGSDVKAGQAFNMLSLSNRSKVCHSLKEAEETKDYYEKEKGRKYHIVECGINDSSPTMWKVVDDKDKYVKGIKYKPVDLKELESLID